MTGVKETTCTSCDHREVCKFSKDFMNAQSAVDSVNVQLGGGRYQMLQEIEFLYPVELKCRYWKLATTKGGAVR